MFSTFDPFVSWFWQLAIGSCPAGADALEICFWQGFHWFT